MTMPEPPPEPDTPAAPEAHWRDRSPAEEAEVWNRTLPNAPERILKAVEEDLAQQARLTEERIKDAAHRRHMEKLHLYLHAAGMAVGSGFLVALLFLAKYAVDHGGTAVPGVVAGVAAVLAALVTGSRAGKDR
ncbi:hypothetical protein [Streptomyces sp. KL118A]|uniref:hypothetical protein n=1 Tax=Streptomyces sp. KL118A TaxID=3045153 RepID=UPI00278C06A0|nr:hypothetical protein [Streptomyces sp. KL118A]